MRDELNRRDVLKSIGGVGIAAVVGSWDETASRAGPH